VKEGTSNCFVWTKATRISFTHVHTIEAKFRRRDTREVQEKKRDSNLIHSDRYENKRTKFRRTEENRVI
jgi:hypothetical protein